MFESYAYSSPWPYSVGNDGLRLQSNFLNLMATVADRAGKVLVRVGGNTQEDAVVDTSPLPNNAAIDKLDTVSNN